MRRGRSSGSSPEPRSRRQPGSLSRWYGPAARSSTGENTDGLPYCPTVGKRGALRQVPEEGTGTRLRRGIPRLDRRGAPVRLHAGGDQKERDRGGKGRPRHPSLAPLHARGRAPAHGPAQGEGGAPPGDEGGNGGR